jgi:hypothetical protein
MNRIVIIGNGFDLAHGLKTSYPNFISWYCEKRFEEFCTNKTGTSKDVLCSFEMKYGRTCSSYADSFLLHQDLSGMKGFNEIIKDKENIKYSSSHFFTNITKSIETKGWVDIENEYYSMLVRDTIFPSQATDYRFLNIQLEYLRQKLIEYLKGIDEVEVNSIDAIKDKIYRPIKKKEIAVANNNYSGRNPEEISPNNILLLSFNYTKTPLIYLQKEAKATINYIHGNLKFPQSIIFGYGDELDSSYEKLRNINDNECLRNIKSIKYLEADNYRKLLEFTESAPFQICIMGHSCGNSDRTLLNTLFEHKNCISVKPYYYIKGDGTDNHLEIVQNISRNFTDMKLMRDRVVNKMYCEPLTGDN